MRADGHGKMKSSSESSPTLAVVPIYLTCARCGHRWWYRGHKKKTECYVCKTTVTVTDSDGTKCCSCGNRVQRLAVRCPQRLAECCQGSDGCGICYFCFSTAGDEGQKNILSAYECPLHFI